MRPWRCGGLSPASSFSLERSLRAPLAESNEGWLLSAQDEHQVPPKEGCMEPLCTWWVHEEDVR